MKKRKLLKRLAVTMFIGSLILSTAGCASKENSKTQNNSPTGTEADAAKTEGAAGAEGDAAAEEPVTIRAAVMTGGFDHYIAVVGLEQGIYEKYGINLEVTEYAWGINTIDAVANGTADYGNMADYATVNRLGNTLHDTNLILFSELYGGGLRSGGLYVAPQYVDDLSKLDGSEGFITSTATVSDYYNSVCFEYLGLDESKQNIVNTDSVTTALALALKGEVSAVYANGANATKYEELGWKLAVPTQDLGINTYAYFLTTKEYNETHQADLVKLLKAFQETFEYIQANLEDTGKFLEGKVGLNAEDFVANWSTYTSKIGFTEDGAVHLQAMEKWAFDHQRFDEEYDVRQFINTDAAKAAFPERVTLKN